MKCRHRRIGIHRHLHPRGPRRAAETHQLGVYDISGRLLHTATFGGGAYELTVTDLPNGPYFVRVTTGRTTTVQRLLVAR